MELRFVRTTLLTITLVGLFAVVRVSAESDTTATADPMPGFGALIAAVAIFIALLIARHKRKQQDNGTSLNE